MLFEDSTPWETALKLKRGVESDEPETLLYSEALAIVLLHELLHQTRDAPRVDANSRGDLAAWQKRKTASYIEEHLAEQISLTKLAEIARVSPYHFAGHLDNPLEHRPTAIIFVGASSVQRFCYSIDPNLSPRLDLISVLARLVHGIN